MVPLWPLNRRFNFTQLDPSSAALERRFEQYPAPARYVGVMNNNICGFWWDIVFQE
jgi:hypothetical protein